MKKKQTADRELGNRSFLSKIEPYLYLLPFAIGIAVFTLYPVINVVLMSFKEGYSHLSRNFDQWGLANYQTVINDPKFAQAIGNTLKYVLLVVPISTCIAVVVAYLLNQKLRFSALFQTAYFVEHSSTGYFRRVEHSAVYDYSAPFRSAEYRSAVLYGSACGWIEGAAHFPAYHCASACADDLSGVHCQYDFLLQGILRAVSVV